MKKSTFILGLIASILGILLCIFLTIAGLNMKVTNPIGDIAIKWGIIGLIGSIAGLVGACLSHKKGLVPGMLLLIASILSIGTALNSITADSPLNFLGGLVVSVLFIISTVFAFITKDK